MLGVCDKKLQEVLKDAGIIDLLLVKDWEELDEAHATSRRRMKMAQTRVG